MSTNALPGQADQPAEIICSKCGHFVGALTRCPHCGARAETRTSVRAFRYAALGLGTIGLGLLYLMATHREIPTIQIGEIKQTMNFAYVKVSGTVSSDPRVFKEGGKARSLRFMVDDGSGEISVTAFRTQAQALVDENRLPRAGDRVEVAGALSMSADDEVVMRLQVPEHLKVLRAEVPVTPLGTITAAQEGSSVMVEGVITKVAVPPAGTKVPWVVALRDDSGEQEITFWQDIYDEFPDKSLLTPGNPVRARVSVRTYKDKLQLMLNTADDMESPSGPKAALKAADSKAPAASARPARPVRSERAGAALRSGGEVPLADLNTTMTGRVVSFYGRVAEVKPPTPETKEPYKVVLEEGGAKILVVYWDNVAQRLGSNTPIIGALMKVNGQLGQYENELEIKIVYSDQLALVDVQPPASKPAPSEGARTIGSVTAADAGRTFTLTGTLGESRSIRGGVIFPLKDDTGEIQLLLWDKQIPGADRDPLAAGLKVRVTGQIGAYREALQITPASIQAVELL